MAKLDLGDDLTVERDVPLGTSRAYALCRQVVVGYEGLGYQVAFEEEHPPESLTAVITGKGALIGVEVQVTPSERSSHLHIELRGHVQVTGMQAMLATAPMVREMAREKLVAFLDATIADVESLEIQSRPASSGPQLDPEPELEPPLTKEESAGSVPAAPSTPLERRLAKVRELHERGLISGDDYESKKQSLLAEL